MRKDGCKLVQEGTQHRERGEKKGRARCVVCFLEGTHRVTVVHIFLCQTFHLLYRWFNTGPRRPRHTPFYKGTIVTSFVQGNGTNTNYDRELRRVHDFLHSTTHHSTRVLHPTTTNTTATRMLAPPPSRIIPKRPTWLECRPGLLLIFSPLPLCFPPNRSY